MVDLSVLLVLCGSHKSRKFLLDPPFVSYQTWDNMMNEQQKHSKRPTDPKGVLSKTENNKDELSTA